MTVSELIDALKKFDGTERVFISGYEGDYNEVDELEPGIFFKKISTPWYYGAFRMIESDEEPEGEQIKGIRLDP